MIARVLSVLFHPIFAPLLSIFLLFQLPLYVNFVMSEEWSNFVYLVILINLIVIPILISVYFKKKGIISSFEMKKVEERTLPYLISSLFYVFTYFLFELINFPVIYLTVFKAATVVVVVLLIFSHLKFKMSAHMAGLGGICGMLFAIGVLKNIDISFLLIFFILISGIIASARYYLKAHSFHELSTGYLSGFIIQITFLSYYNIG